MIVVLLAAVANIFFQIPALAWRFPAAAVLIFSAYILYDISRIVQGGETNYITATLAVYLDIWRLRQSPEPADGLFRRTRLSLPGQATKAASMAAFFVPIAPHSFSKTAIDSTWAVWGNILTAPAA